MPVGKREVPTALALKVLEFKAMEKPKFKGKSATVSAIVDGTEMVMRTLENGARVLYPRKRGRSGKAITNARAQYLHENCKGKKGEEAIKCRNFALYQDYETVEKELGASAVQPKKRGRPAKNK